MTLPSWASPATAWSRNALLVLACIRPRLSGRSPKARPNAASTLRAWRGRRDRRAAEFCPSTRRTSSSRMNRVDRHPEVVAHHDDALHPAAVALPQGLHQFGVLFVLLGVQPLLELVEDEQHLLARLEEALAPAQRRQRLDQTQVGRQAGQRFAQAVQQAGLRLLGGRLDVDRRSRASASRGSSPAFTSDDLPQPDGP